MTEGERIRALEVQYLALVQDLAETREALADSTRQMRELQRALDAIFNQGKGAGLLAKAFVMLGGLGWLAGLYAFAKVLFTAGRLP